MDSAQPGPDQPKRVPAALPLATAAVSALIAVACWQPLSGDMAQFLVPWFEYLESHGSYAALADDFSNYTVPYLYLLGVSTLFSAWATPQTLIRLLSCLFVALSAWPVYRLARTSGWPRRSSWAIVATWLVLPETVLNSAVWGQCDIIYSLFLVAFLWALLQQRPALALACFGVALSFKLQALFLAPFVIYALLARLVRWWQALFIVPAVFVLSTVPAFLAGRPLWSLLTVYARQADTDHELAVNAANPWTLVQGFFVQARTPQAYEVGVRIGGVLAFGVLLSLVVAMFRWTRRGVREDMLVMATLSTLCMPYVLPVMHERYLFPAGLFAFLLAVERPQYWPVAALIQCGNVLAYTVFLIHAPRPVLAPATGLITLAIGWLIVVFARRRTADACTLPRAPSLSPSSH